MEKKNKYPTKDATCKVYDKLLGGEWWAEWPFYEGRRWRFDYAYPKKRIAIEIDGGVFTGGRHSGGVGQLRDMEKMNMACTRGWLVYHYIPDMKFSLEMRQQVLEAIKLRENIDFE